MLELYKGKGFSQSKMYFFETLGEGNYAFNCNAKFDDKGKLGNHHIYFKNKNGLPNLNTLTEFAYIPNRVVNGKYFLSLNFPNFYLDTAPSRPILFPLKIK